MLKPNIQQIVDNGLSQMGMNAGVMALQFMELCVKAEPMVLTNVVVMTGRGTLRIEECADVTIPEKYYFQIYVRNPNDLPALRQAIFNLHPEFEFSTKPAMVYEGQTEEEDSLIVTMPEVTKERRDLLNTLTEATYKRAQVKVDIAHGKILQKLAPELLKYPECEDETKKYLEMNSDYIKDKMKTSYEEKLKEIADAYEEYEKKKAQDQQADKDPVDSDDETMNGSRLNVEDWKLDE